MIALGALSAVLWTDDARRAGVALEAALRAAIVTAQDAPAHGVTTGPLRGSVLRMPSNKPTQPAPVASGTFTDAHVTVACDAILINVDALCAEMSLPSSTDPAQIIASLYIRDGEAGLDRLDGDFAFVLYDDHRDVLLARRDPFGVRPLFWAWLPGGGLAFASLPEAIVDAGLIPAKRDVDAVIDLIASSSARKPQTLVKGLYRVPACTQMTFRASDAGQVPEPKVYWRPGQRPADVPPDFEGWTRELRHRMDRAVSRRVPASGDLGASISSGLDSTSVTMLAERHLGEDQHIFATTYAASEAAAEAYPGMMDETEVASAVVAGSNRISWQPVRLHPERIVDNERVALATWAMAVDETPELETPRLAASHCADVLLTGWGGDNTISYKGFGTSAALLRKGRFRALRQMCKDLGRTGFGAARFYAGAVLNTVVPMGSRLREMASGPKRETLNYNHRMYTGLKPEHRRGSDLLEFRTNDLRENRLQDIMSPVLAMRIEVLSCHGLRHGVRYIHPLLDRDLINFSITCPPEFEYRDGHFRAPVRAAMEGIVHDAARLRTQTGLPFAEAGLNVARKLDEMRAQLDALEQDPRLAPYFDFAFVRQAMARQPSYEQVEAHVKDVSTRKQKSQWPLNSSFVAISRMLAVQSALDEAERGNIPRDPTRLR